MRLKEIAMEIFIKDIQSNGLLHRESICCDLISQKENYLEVITEYTTKTVTQILPINPNWMYIIIDENSEDYNG